MTRRNKWFEAAVWVGVVAAVVLGIVVFASLGGCSQAERTGLTQTFTRTAVETGLDRLETKLSHFLEQYTPPSTPTEPVSPLQGLVGAAGMMAVYLVRKRFFPMGKR